MKLEGNLKVDERFFRNQIDKKLDLTMLRVFTSLFAVLSDRKDGKDFDMLQVVSLSTF